MADNIDEQGCFIADQSGSLRGDCEKCFGLCCAAFYFSRSDGFPLDKEAGHPCLHLRDDFRCCIHQDLREQGYKGCTAFDCFGAGQKISQITFQGNDWRSKPVIAMQMFDAFHIMLQLHELLWYLEAALELESARLKYQEIRHFIDETRRLTELDPDKLLQVDTAAHREMVKELLLQVSELVRSEYNLETELQKNRKMRLFPGADLAGKDLKRIELRGANLRGTCLIAADLKGKDLSGADLIGADLRDADIRGSDLSKAIFFTQMQVNGAKGDGYTRLPASLSRPLHW